MTKVLIDADILVYTSAWAVQKTHYTHKEELEFFDGISKAKAWFKEEFPDREWDLEEWDVVDHIEPWSACQFLIDAAMTKIMDQCQADTYEAFLSPSRTFRHDIATVRPYKDRKQPSPFYKDKAREYLIKSYHAKIGNGVEADDLLGLNQDTDTIIASIDKDLLMIPGRHYNINKEEFITVDLLEADEMFFCQLVAGDSTDNIQGVPKWGMIKAAKLVAEFEGDHKGLVEYIEELYETAYSEQGKKIMYEMATLVWILRKGDTPQKAGWQELLNAEG